MTTTTHDTGISWMDCPVCAELHREVERADAEADKAWETYSFFATTYRDAFDAGMVGCGTTAWSRWHDLLDQILHTYYDAADIVRARMEAWGESIREHANPQTTEAETTDEADPDDDMPCMIDVHTPCTGHCCAAETDDGTAETEEMVAISKADAVDELVNVYGGHIDKWLEELRARSFVQTAEPMPQDRDAYERMWYGDVPEVTLPPSFAYLSPMTLTHCARAIGLYQRRLKNHVPSFDDYPAQLAHRLMDAFDDAAEAREAALAGGEGEKR